jgi:hypothetical protein
MSDHQDSEVDKVAQAIQGIIGRASRGHTIVRPARSASMIAKFFPASGIPEAEIAERITMAAIHALVRVDVT